MELPAPRSGPSRGEYPESWFCDRHFYMWVDVNGVFQEVQPLNPSDTSSHYRLPPECGVCRIHSVLFDGVTSSQCDLNGRGGVFVFDTIILPVACGAPPAVAILAQGLRAEGPFGIY